MKFSQLHYDMNSRAPERCKSFTFDVNQQAESLVGWEQNYNQHSSGAFHGYLDELTLGGMHLFEEYTNQTLMQQCCVNENNIWLGFSPQLQRPKINNNEITSGQLMIRPSGIDFELLTPQEFHIFGLVLDKCCIQDEMTGLDADIWLNHSSKALISEPNNYVTYELAKLIRLLLNENSPLSTMMQNDKMRSRLEHLKPLIASKMADLLVQSESGIREIQVVRPAKRRVLDKIRQHVEQTGQYPLTITELCNIAYVSRRTLQYCFEHELNVSPIQYLRDCRLNEIRRILLKSSEDIVISDLAIDFGFFHISTFNQHYKQLFGETPTQTIKRSNTYRQPSQVQT